MSIVSLHPGVTIEQVIENTGFTLSNDFDKEQIPYTKEPTDEELDILRESIDPQKLLQRF